MRPSHYLASLVGGAVIVAAVGCRLSMLIVMFIHDRFVPPAFAGVKR